MPDRATAGLERHPLWLSVELVRGLFGSAAEFAAFVTAGCNQVAEQPGCK